MTSSPVAEGCLRRGASRVSGEARGVAQEEALAVLGREDGDNFELPVDGQLRVIRVDTTCTRQRPSSVALSGYILNAPLLCSDIPYNLIGVVR